MFRTLSMIRRAFHAAPIDIGGQLLTVTVSLGIAECQPGERLDTWFARADGALYVAKRSGRNRVSSEEQEAGLSPVLVPAA